MLKKLALSATLTFALLLAVANIPELGAYVASSPNFRMEYDSLNNEGGLGSTDSGSFNLEDTMGEDAIGISSSENYKIKAGFQQMQEVNLSLSPTPEDVVMDPISGVTGGTSDSSVTWTVTTDNPGGYTFSIKADNSPAMTSSSSSIADYTPEEGDVPDFSWDMDAGDSEFGYSPESTDLIDKFKDNGFNTCASGTNQTPDKCWYNFKTSNETISQSTGRNDPAGTTTTFKLKAESGSNRNQESGTYSTELTVTVAAN